MTRGLQSTAGDDGQSIASGDAKAHTPIGRPSRTTASHSETRNAPGALGASGPALIKLTQGKFALVDAGLFDELSKFKWHAHRGGKTFYALREIQLPDGRFNKWPMQNEVFRLLGEVVAAGYSIDHKDRNGLNNQRHNLRQATQSEQKQNCGKQKSNTSGYIGVLWHKRHGKWQAYARENGSMKHLGYFDDKIEAARVRDEYVLKHYGEFAVLNF